VDEILCVHTGLFWLYRGGLLRMYVQGSFAYVCYRALLRKYRAFLFIQRRSFAYVCTGLFCVSMYRLFLRMYVEGSFAEASGSVFF